MFGMPEMILVEAAASGHCIAPLQQGAPTCVPAFKVTAPLFLIKLAISVLRESWSEPPLTAATRQASAIAQTRQETRAILVRTNTQLKQLKKASKQASKQQFDGTTKTKRYKVGLEL